MNAATATNKESAAEQKFDWPLCYEADNFLLERIDAFLKQNTFARVLADRMRDETGTLFLDWVDHLHLPEADEKTLRDFGFTDDPLGENKAGQRPLWHPEAMLPRILLAATNAKYPPVVAIRPEFVHECRRARHYKRDRRRTAFAFPSRARLQVCVVSGERTRPRVLISAPRRNALLF